MWRLMLDLGLGHNFYTGHGPMGMAFSWRGCSLPTIPQLGEDRPVEDPGLCGPPGEPGWLSW